MFVSIGFDLSKTFDTINHDLLLADLKANYFLKNNRKNVLNNQFK